MDTISRENNSMLPVGAIIVGVIALLLGGYAAITVSKVNKTVTEHDAKIAKIDSIEATANQAVSVSETAKKNYNDLRAQTQAGFDQVGPIIGTLQASVTKLEDAVKKPTPAATGKEKDNKDKKGAGEAVAAGPGEYVIKPGDSGMKIATTNGVSLGDLQTVNPGVNWNSLKPGHKLKLPKK